MVLSEGQVGLLRYDPARCSMNILRRTLVVLLEHLQVSANPI